MANAAVPAVTAAAVAAAVDEREAKLRLKRENIIKEIIDTEATYVNRLRLAKEKIIEPLHETNILNAADQQTQFTKLENIYALHSRFSTSEFSLNPMKLVELFEHLCANFTAYSEYLIEYEIAMQRRGYLLTTNRRFAEFIDKAQRDPQMHNLDLESMLIMPVQRIPRYRMLLEQLLKVTPEEHQDYAAVRQALDKICSMAQYNNEAIRERENKLKLMSIMMQIESRSRVDLMDDDKRRYIKDGPLLRQCRRGLKEFHFWLLSDKLLYAQNVPPLGLALNRQIPLSQCFVSSCESIYNQQHSFIVESPQKSFIVMTGSESEKVEWLSAIKEAIEQQRISKGADDGKLAPLWIPDAKSTCCTRCRSGFTLIFRRHHCRNCGAIVCERCSSKRYLLEHVNHKKQVRVCDACHVFLTSQAGEEARRRNSSVKLEAVEARATITGYYDSDGEGDATAIAAAVTAAAASESSGFVGSDNCGMPSATATVATAADVTEDTVADATTTTAVAIAAIQEEQARSITTASVDVRKLSGYSDAVREATADMFSRPSTLQILPGDDSRLNLDETELDDFNDLMSDPQQIQQLTADLKDAVRLPELEVPVVVSLQRQFSNGLLLESPEITPRSLSPVNFNLQQQQQQPQQQKQQEQTEERRNVPNNSNNGNSGSSSGTSTRATRAQFHSSIYICSSDDSLRAMRDSTASVGSSSRESSFDLSKQSLAAKIAALNASGKVFTTAAPPADSRASTFYSNSTSINGNSNSSSNNINNRSRTLFNRALPALPADDEDFINNSSNSNSSRHSKVPPPKPPKPAAARRMTQRRTNILVNIDAAALQQAIREDDAAEAETAVVVAVAAGNETCKEDKQQQQSAMAAIAVAAAARAAAKQTDT